MTEVHTRTIETQVPARLDRLPWSRFHWRVVLGLGTVWTLDGLEVTMVGSVASRLTEADSGLGLTPGQIGVSAAIYILGACLGALVFGQLTDRFGRKKLFLATLLIYIAATVATAFSFSVWCFFLCRFITGAGIGGEYAAIHSAIDELIPARVRGRVDLLISGTYWLGAAGGAGLAILFLNESIFPADVGWRLAFGVGAVLGLVILFVRRHVPESPRWLFIHGREDEAERVVDGIERTVEAETGEELDEPGKTLRVRQRRTIPIKMIAGTAFKLYPKRAVLGIALFVGQAFLYNGITFNLGTLMSTFFGVAAAITPVFFVLFALGNFLGPLTLGRLFDSVGRKPMITLTYLGSALLTLPLAWWFVTGALTRWTFIAMVIAVFFLASAGASAAYLTVSEIFPMETRALAIAFFYAVGTAVGGITGPLLFGQLIGSNDPDLVAVAFLVGAGVMALGGLAEIAFGVRSERADLEAIAAPLTAHEAESADTTGPPGRSGQGAGRSDRPAQARRSREEAALARARAAEHRAAVHELAIASWGDAPTGSSEAAMSTDGVDRQRVEKTLAEIDDLRALEFDEQAIAQEELAFADEADGHAAGAATHRARAAEHRALAHADEAAALVAEDDGTAASHRALARAAAERSRAAAQRALAEQVLVDQQEPESDESGEVASTRDGGDELSCLGPDEVARARSAMHTAWAEVHDERSRVETDLAEGRSSAGDRTSGLQQRALAAEQHLQAAEHRAAAGITRAHREAAEQAEKRQAARAERERRADQLEERVRRRTAHRAERERHGLRRFPAGSRSVPESSVGWTECRTGRQRARPRPRDRDRGAGSVGAGRHRLARPVPPRRSAVLGPGRFGAALDAAVEEGRVRRLSRRTYGPTDGAPGAVDRDRRQT
ncbi:hypothetical protein GCM10023199_50970 [Actinomycetospora chibensis]